MRKQTMIVLAALAVSGLIAGCDGEVKRSKGYVHGEDYLKKHTVDIEERTVELVED